MSATPCRVGWSLVLCSNCVMPLKYYQKAMDRKKIFGVFKDII